MSKVKDSPPLYSVDWVKTESKIEQVDIAWRKGKQTWFLRYPANMVNHIAFTIELLVSSGYKKIKKLPYHRQFFFNYELQIINNEIINYELGFINIEIKDNSIMNYNL